MESEQLATSSQHSATVMASAGTGKTWLLVTRLVRLLVEGVAPDSILAVTFTRKAAAEMAARLAERLHTLAIMDTAEREQVLLDIGLQPTTARLHITANLYEKHLFDSRQLRITTFHAFCQELLHRFPLEADVPAGFEVLDGSRLIEETAWDALVDEVTRLPNSPLAQSLEELFQCFNGHHGTKAALMSFLNHRSDWWAYTLNKPKPVDFAYQNLAAQLEIDMKSDPLSRGLTATLQKELQLYAEMLRRHDTATFNKAANLIERALDNRRNSEDRMTSLNHALLRKSTTPKASKALVKSLGVEGQTRLIALYEKLSAWILDIQDQYRRRRTLTLSHAWYRAGTALLDHYQRLKIEQRVLDFSDLEWKTYILLNHADHALWVQYKLDQRIDHILIDEFQDTNPTQWHLIFPLLQELASEGQRRRTVFLVGDAKQSIYRFRRAEPDLFPTAQLWLRQHLQAIDSVLTSSWRSSPAIIKFINRIFGEGALHAQLTEFRKHTTQHDTLWGCVEVMPLITSQRSEPTATTQLRNPLHQPRELIEDRRHRREGDAIAERINVLLQQATPIGHGARIRPIRYDDIMILVRHRTHVRAYEEALRIACIPYVTASRGTLLDCIEITDLVALLQALIVPYNNLGLATVLRSPLFDCSDDDLMKIAAEPGGYWLDRLWALSPRLAPGTPLARAAYWLHHWQNLADKRPVHDLLDRIYSEGNIVARYEAALPEYLRPRVRANLTRFIELALETDSGRYPSLTMFLRRLAALKAQEEDAPDEGAESTASGSIRLSTIHAAKGLEAPVVFLADSTTGPPARRAYQTMIRWPVHTDRPSHFLLCGKPDEVDNFSNALVDDELRQEQREYTNLLYVAVTRAKQLLFISGCKPNRGQDLGWYGAIATQLGDPDGIQQEGWRLSSGTVPPSNAHALPAKPTLNMDPELTKPMPSTPMDFEIAPSRSTIDSMDHQGDEKGRLRGLAIHRFLQLLSDTPAPDYIAIRQHIIAELVLDAKIYPIDEWQAEAEHIITHPSMREWFDPDCYDAVFKEVPIYYYHNDALVHGVVDRIVIKDGICSLIDYKTHRNATADKLAAMAAPYQEQIRLYAEGIARLWPNKIVRSFLLFTACAGIYSCGEESTL